MFTQFVQKVSNLSLTYSNEPVAADITGRERTNRSNNLCLVQSNMDDSLAAGVVMGTRLNEGGAT